MKFSQGSEALTTLQNPSLDSETRQELTYLFCYWNFELFVSIFLNDHCRYPFSKMHYDYFKLENDPTRRGRRDVIAAPRGHAKTTLIAFAKILHAIVYGYEPHIVIIGHSLPEAESKVRDVIDELQHNPLILEIFGQLIPKRGQPGFGTKKCDTLNGLRLQSKSKGNQVRGLKFGKHRPSLVILDDIESPEEVLKEEQRYKTKQWLEKDVLKLTSVDGHANFIVIGTCLHADALLPNLLDSTGWKGRRYRAVISFALNEPLWDEWKSIYTDLFNENRVEEAEAFFKANEAAMLEGTEVLWPEAEPYYKLMKLIVDEGRASFQSEKQNEPFDPERQIFVMANAKRFKEEYDEQGKWMGVRWLDGSNRFVSKHQMTKMVAYHDPAMCENKDNDYAAIVIGARDTHGYIYCLEAFIEKVPPSKQIKHAYTLQGKWGFRHLYVETNNFQGVLKDQYFLSKPEDNPLMVHGIDQHSNKGKRISSVEPLVANGQLLFSNKINPRLLSQFDDFPNSQNDDGPDAVYGMVQQLRRGVYRIGD